MNQGDALKDLSHIRSLMEKSTKFISISGLSGILMGTYTILSFLFLYNTLNIEWPNQGDIQFNNSSVDPKHYFVTTAVILLILSITTAVYLGLKKARKSKQSAWNAASKAMLLSVLTPLLVGGIFAVMSCFKGYYHIIAPSFLIFYGLALYSGSNFSFKELRVLGILQIILGLLAYAFMPFGILFFTAGFGLLHILYGVIILKKYGA